MAERPFPRLMDVDADASRFEFFARNRDQTGSIRPNVGGRSGRTDRRPNSKNLARTTGAPRALFPDKALTGDVSSTCPCSVIGTGRRPGANASRRCGPAPQLATYGMERRSMPQTCSRSMCPAGRAGLAILAIAGLMIAPIFLGPPRLASLRKHHPIQAGNTVQPGKPIIAPQQMGTARPTLQF